MEAFVNKMKFLLLTVLLASSLKLTTAHAQDDDMIFPDSDETLIPPQGSTDSAPVLIEDDSSDVSDTEEYDG